MSLNVYTHTPINCQLSFTLKSFFLCFFFNCNALSICARSFIFLFLLHKSNCIDEVCAHKKVKLLRDSIVHLFLIDQMQLAKSSLKSTNSQFNPAIKKETIQNELLIVLALFLSSFLSKSSSWFTAKVERIWNKNSSVYLFVVVVFIWYEYSVQCSRSYFCFTIFTINLDFNDLSRPIDLHAVCALMKYRKWKSIFFSLFVDIFNMQKCNFYLNFWLVDEVRDRRLIEITRIWFEMISRIVKMKRNK